MVDDEEPLEDRLRRALRIEQVVAEVASLKGELQRIGSRLVTLRAELVALGADPAVVSGEFGSVGQPVPPIGNGRGSSVPGSSSARMGVEVSDADVGPEPAPPAADLVSFDAVWSPNED